MKTFNKYKYLCAVLLISIFSNIFNNVFCQNINNKSINDTSQVNTINNKIELPELQYFIDYGLQNSYLVKMNDNEIEQAIQKIKIEKSSWTDNVFIEGTTKYGLFNQLIVSGEAGLTTSEVGVKSANQQFNYFTGLTMKIPISELINKKKSIKILNKDLDNSKLKKQQLINDYKLLVIDQYFKVVNLKEVFSFLQEDIQSKEIAYLKAVKDIESGIISIIDFSNIVTERRKSRESYYKTKNDFFAEMNKLQIITGLNLINNFK